MNTLNFKFKLDDFVKTDSSYGIGRIIGISVEYNEWEVCQNRSTPFYAYKVYFPSKAIGLNGRTITFKEESLKLSVIDYVKEKKSKIQSR